MLPSWMRSSRSRPRLTYFLAIETTRRRLASTKADLAVWTSLSPGRAQCRQEGTGREGGVVRRASCGDLVRAAVALAYVGGQCQHPSPQEGGAGERLPRATCSALHSRREIDLALPLEQAEGSRFSQ